MRQDHAFEVETGLAFFGGRGEAVVDGDAVGVDHGLLSRLLVGVFHFGKGRGRGGNGKKRGRETYEFKITLQTLHNQTDGLWLHQLCPFLAVSWVDMHGEVGDPVDSCGFGVAVVVDVVYVALCEVSC